MTDALGPLCGILSILPFSMPFRVYRLKIEAEDVVDACLWKLSQRRQVRPIDPIVRSCITSLTHNDCKVNNPFSQQSGVTV